MNVNMYGTKAGKRNYTERADHDPYRYIKFQQPPPRDVWSTMSAGDMSFLSMSGIPHANGPAGPVVGVGVGGGGPLSRGPPLSIPETTMDEDYLEPTGTSSPADPGWQRRREGYKPRGQIVQLDSGVADVDGLHLMVDNNMNGIGPRTSDVSLPASIADRERMRRPDSLAVKGHEYEELPASRYQARYGYQGYEEMDDNSGSGSGSAPRPLPPPMLNKIKSQHQQADSNESLCRPLSGTSSNGNDRISSTYRKRENPLYDEGDPDDLEVKPKKPCDVLGCPCTGFLIVAIIALTALILAILLYAGTVQPKQEISLSPETAELVDKLNHSSLLAALDQMKRIETQYNSLLQKFDRLNSSVRNELTSMWKSVNSSNKALSTRVIQVQEDFDTKFNSLSSSLATQIDDVSKQEGPQGPRGPAGAAGVGNLTACEYFSQKRGTAIGATSTTTDWWPETSQDHQRWVILGIECTTTGGTNSMMETQRQTMGSINDAHQFRCTCTGSDSSSTSRYCLLNIWRCPRIS